MKIPSMFEAFLDNREFYKDCSDIPRGSIEAIAPWPVPSTIKIATAPLKGTIEKKPIEKFIAEISAKRGLIELFPYIWTELNFIPSKVKVKYNILMSEQQILNMDEEFKKMLDNPIDLVMVDMGPYDYGVITNQDIKAGQFVTHYAGRIRLRTENYNTTYSIGMDCETALFSPISISGYGKNRKYRVIKEEYKKSIIDAEYMGNFGSFLQHLPESKDLPDKLNLHEDIYLNIATDNLEAIVVSYENYPHYVFRANRDIFKGELLGYKYAGDGYKLRRQNKIINPALFTRSGELTPYSMNATTRQLYSFFSRWNSSKTQNKNPIGFSNYQQLILCGMVNKASHAAVMAAKKALAKEVLLKK